jgi:hypothetical protein
LSLWAVGIAAAAGILVFFAWANRQTAKAHARFAAKDVEAALTELLDPHAHDHGTWDLFLAWPIDDPYLESIRLECLRICQECPPAPGRDINEEGERRVAALLADLRRRNSPSNGAADALSASQ